MFIQPVPKKFCGICVGLTDTLSLIYDTLDLAYYMFIQPSQYTPGLPPTDNINSELCHSAPHNIMYVGSALKEAMGCCLKFVDI